MRNQISLKMGAVGLATMVLLLGTNFAARAQVILDMSLITCRNYLDYDGERQNMVAAWMSGYFNASINQPLVSYDRFQYNKKVVTDYCRQHLNETLMSAIRQTVF